MFNKYKNKIQELEKSLSFYQKSCNELQEDINKLKEENKNLKNINTQLNDKLIDMNSLSQENEIMRKYYKLDEDLSSDVQAKVLTDLRIHDIEYQLLKEKMDEIKTLQYHNSLSMANAIHYIPYYY